jgi:hypothetical protein
MKSLSPKIRSATKLYPRWSKGEAEAHEKSEALRKAAKFALRASEYSTTSDYCLTPESGGAFRKARLIMFGNRRSNLRIGTYAVSWIYSGLGVHLKDPFSQFWDSAQEDDSIPDRDITSPTLDHIAQFIIRAASLDGHHMKEGNHA